MNNFLLMDAIYGRSFVSALKNIPEFYAGKNVFKINGCCKKI